MSLYREERREEKELKREETAEMQVVTNAINALLQHVEGQEFLNWLIGDHQDPFTGNALTTAYACGWQARGKYVEDTILGANPEAAVILAKAAIKEPGNE